VQTDPNHEAFWVVTLDEQQLELVNENAHKLELEIKIQQSIHTHTISAETVSSTEYLPSGMR